MAYTKGRNEDMETGEDSRFGPDVLSDPGVDNEENETDSGMYNSAKGTGKYVDPHSYNKNMIHPSFPAPVDSSRG